MKHTTLFLLLALFLLPRGNPVFSQSGPSGDTMRYVTDTLDIYFYAQGCLMVNGEFIDYFDPSETAELSIESVFRLNPGDSCNIYYWGYAEAGTDTSGGDRPVGFYLSQNTASDTMNFETLGGGDNQEGMLSFINTDINYDLLVLKLTDLNHQYHIRYAFDQYPKSTVGIWDKSFFPSLEFFPNPAENQAFVKTNKDVVLLEVLDVNGKISFSEDDPVKNAEGLYTLDLEGLDTGIWIVRFLYSDNSADAVKIIVE